MSESENSIPDRRTHNFPWGGSRIQETHTFRAADWEMHSEKQFGGARPGWSQRHGYPGQQNTATCFAVYLLYCGQCYYVQDFNSTPLNPEDRMRRQWGPETDLCLWTFPGLSFCFLVLSGLCNAVLHSRASWCSSLLWFVFSVSKHMGAGPTQANSHSVPAYSR